MQEVWDRRDNLSCSVLPCPASPLPPWFLPGSTRLALRHLLSSPCLRAVVQIVCFRDGFECFGLTLSHLHLGLNRQEQTKGTPQHARYPALCPSPVPHHSGGCSFVRRGIAPVDVVLPKRVRSAEVKDQGKRIGTTSRLTCFVHGAVVGTSGEAVLKRQNAA